MFNNTPAWKLHWLLGQKVIQDCIKAVQTKIIIIRAIKNEHRIDIPLNNTTF